MAWVGGPPRGEAQTYRVSLPLPGWGFKSDQPLISLLTPSCARTNVILEEDNRPYLWCSKCDTFVSQKDLNSQNLATEFFRRGEERKQSCLEKEDAQAGKEMEITAYGNSLPRSPTSSTFVEYSWHCTITVQWWSTTFGEHGRSGSSCPGC